MRLLLLPITRRTLYVAQSASAFGDIWVVLMLPVLLFLPVGVAAGGLAAAALFTLICGAMLVAVVIGLSSLATSLLHLAVRDRRRGEILALLFILLIPMIALLPEVLRRPAADRGTTARRAGTAGRAGLGDGHRPERVRAVSDGGLHVRDARGGARGSGAGRRVS